MGWGMRAYLRCHFGVKNRSRRSGQAWLIGLWGKIFWNRAYFFQKALALYFPTLLSLASRHAAVAQLDRASDYGSEGLGFDSLQLHHF